MRRTENKTRRAMMRPLDHAYETASVSRRRMFLLELGDLRRLYHPTAKPAGGK